MVSKSAAVNRAFHRFLARLERTIRPERVILFGTRARGDHRGTSDFDLLIVSKSFRGVAQSVFQPASRYVTSSLRGSPHLPPLSSRCVRHNRV